MSRVVPGLAGVKVSEPLLVLAPMKTVAGLSVPTPEGFILIVTLAPEELGLSGIVCMKLFDASSSAEETVRVGVPAPLVTVKSAPMPFGPEITKPDGLIVTGTVTGVNVKVPPFAVSVALAVKDWFASPAAPVP